MKQLILLFTVFLLSCTLTLPITNDWETVQPDAGQRFRIFQSYIRSYPGGKDTLLRVILCTDDITDQDAIFEEIRAFTTRMNGEDDELTIHLFRSKMDMENDVELGTRTYIKGD